MSTNSSAGQHPGLPATGPGSPASWPRRFGALALDWLLANLIAVAMAGPKVWDAGAGQVWLPLACWYLMVVAATAATGGSPGQLALRVRVAHLGGRRVNVVMAAVRTALIALVIPPLVFTRDGRGLHDLASHTAVVNVS